MSSGQQILQFLTTGITNGSIYALIALGFVVIHSVTSVINFAQGEFAMLGALLAISLMSAGLPKGLAVMGAVAGVGTVAAILYRVALRPVRDSSPLTMIIITIGAALSIRGVAAASAASASLLHPHHPRTVASRLRRESVGGAPHGNSGRPYGAFRLWP
jgi:branched-chain amino acid transport system permease protein